MSHFSCTLKSHFESPKMSFEMISGSGICGPTAFHKSAGGQMIFQSFGLGTSRRVSALLLFNTCLCKN